MNKRLIPAAAGLIFVYAGLFQLTTAAPMFAQVVTSDLDAQLGMTMISLVLALGGLIAFGYCVVAQKSVLPAAIAWGVGAVGSLVAIMKMSDGEISAPMLVVIAVQQFGGLVAVIFVARPDATAPPLRRELGALLIVMAVGHVIGTVWTVIYQFHMFDSSQLTIGSALSFSIWPLVTFVVSAFAVRAALALLAGEANAQTKVTVWKWVAIGISFAMAILTFVSYWRMDHDLPTAMFVQPFVGAALGAIWPFMIGHLAERTRDEPVDPRDAASVPTVLAWAALYLVPLLLAAALVVRSSFMVGILGDDKSHYDLVAALCAVAAVLLLATSIAVVRGLSFAKWLTHGTAVLSVCAAVYIAYESLQLDWRNARSVATIMPVGSFMTFAAAMVLLAWFEGRREQDLAPARVVD